MLCQNHKQMVQLKFGFSDVKNRGPCFEGDLKPGSP